MVKLPKATHEGELDLAGIKLSVAVLDDGRRVITQSSVFRAFGRTKRGRALHETRVLNRPPFVDAKNLQPFIGSDLEGVLKKVDYETKTGKKSDGFDANILPLLCKLYLDTREAKALKDAQLPLARASEMLLISLSKIGIIALVDEATGYQYDREKDELQKILSKYISEELLPRQKRFPDAYYKELFRLNGRDFTVSGIKKRPSVIGKRTNTLIYKMLPPGVLEELKNKTPKTVKGDYSSRLHQSLSEDVGTKHLQDQITEVITIFRMSDNMKDMRMQFEKLNRRKAGEMQLPFNFDDKGHTIEPKDKTTLSDFDQKLTKAIEYNPKEKEG